MCGIVGLVEARSTANPDAVREAADLLFKRGPDGSGLWSEDNVAFGHRRLAIIDVSDAGQQPMFSADGRYVIVFNGEIYNFAELRAELCADESRWQSRSDTEVILAAYQQWGTACLNRFRGMYAFAIWDRHSKALFAARDPMGVKPFYYHFGQSRFAFASRPRALFALDPLLSKEIDEQALRYYLEMGYVPAPWSIHKDVRKLPPAHYLTLDASGLKVERYWAFATIAPVPSWERRSEEDLLDELDEIVSRSVRLRMVSDVPLGAFLSGGIDSSLVVAAMQRQSSRPVRCFTIGFNEPQYDESDHAAEVARIIGAEHDIQRLNVDDLLALMPTFRAEYDEPFFDHSAFPTLAVSRMARTSVTVSLSGDGGDELFGGYHYYRIMYGLTPLLRAPHSLRKAAAGLIRQLPQHSMKLLAGALRQPDATAAFAFARSISKDYEPVLQPDVLARTMSSGALFSAASEQFSAGLGPTDVAMRLDASYTLPDDYLQKVDVASMAFSLEARDPLLDRDLVEWAMKLPLKWKLRAGGSKYLLRRLAYRYLPRRVLDRPKQGFTMPIDRWLREPLKKWAHERLSDPRSYDGLPLERRRVEQLFKLHLSGTRNVSPMLWAVLVLLDFAVQP